MKINALLEKLLSRTILSLFLVYTLFPMLWLVMASLKRMSNCLAILSGYPPRRSSAIM